VIVDQALNVIIQYGKSVAAVVDIIWRGKLLMDGLCDWLETCISVYGISADLLEGKVQHLLDTMNLLCGVAAYI
jgi:hypothetical protein